MPGESTLTTPVAGRIFNDDAAELYRKALENNATVSTVLKEVVHEALLVRRVQTQAPS